MTSTWSPVLTLESPAANDYSGGSSYPGSPTNANWELMQEYNALRVDQDAGQSYLLDITTAATPPNSNTIMLGGTAGPVTNPATQPWTFKILHLTTSAPMTQSVFVYYPQNFGGVRFINTTGVNFNGVGNYFVYICGYSEQAGGTHGCRFVAPTTYPNGQANLIEVVFPAGSRALWGGYGAKPVGSICDFIAPNTPPPPAPESWRLCDGHSELTADLDLLFSKIGYAFGGSGGSFNMPNYTPYATIGGVTVYKMIRS